MNPKPGPVMNFLKQLMKKLGADEVSRRAAALAFYSFLALAPLLIILVSILGLIYGKSGAQAHIIEQAQSAVGATAASALKTVIEHASSHGGGIIGVAVGGVLLLLGAATIFSELRADLNVIWQAEQPAQASFLHKLADHLLNRLLTFLALLAVGLLVLISVLASALVSGFGHRLSSRLPAASVILQVAEFLVFLAILTMLIAFLFKVLPGVKIHWKQVWIGALITAFLFSIGKLAIGLYLGRSSTSSSYGAAGAFVVLLLWIYYSAQILFVGAEVTVLLAKRAGDDSPNGQEAQAPESRKSSRAANRL
jgi:membrane protein